MSQTIEKIVYQEEITSRYNTIAGTVTGVLAIGFLGALIKELVSPTARYSWAVPLGLFCLFLLICIAMFIIRTLKITITEEALTVAFRFIHKAVPLNKINKYSIEKNPNGAYRVQGMYNKTVDGNRSWVYSASTSPKIVLDLKEEKYSRLVFSSNNPEQIIDILDVHLKL